MSEAFQIMLWPLVACLVLPGILIYFGLHIIKREIIFVDLALAQVAALGTCVAILMQHESHDWQTFAWSGAFTIVGAAIFTLTRPRERRVPQEALIGIVYVVAAAAGLLLLSRSPEGNEELRKTLVGDVLLVQPLEIVIAGAAFALVGVLHYFFRRPFLALSFDHAGARTAGLKVWWWDFLFYALFGVVVTIIVHLFGVLLTFSFLIIPAVCANLLVRALAVQLVVGWIIAALAGGAGLCASYQLDLPTGAAVVVALGLALLLIGLGSSLWHRCCMPR
ncbi:MAG: metal ABC transporter permease [Verrucomicrobia bacterium]|nr:MAG: metal ABC transporter permease [Verrucomicrobiota bacterium]